MIHKAININHAAAGGSMNTHRMLIPVFIAAAVSVMSVDVSMRLFDMFLEMDLDVPLRIARAKEGMGKVAA